MFKGAPYARDNEHGGTPNKNRSSKEAMLTPKLSLSVSLISRNGSYILRSRAFRKVVNDTTK